MPLLNIKNSAIIKAELTLQTTDADKMLKKSLSKHKYNDEKLYTASQILAAFALAATLKFGLLPALISGLLIYHIVEVSTPLLGKVGIVPVVGKIITLVTIAIIVITVIALGVMGLKEFLSGDSGGVVGLLQKMADIISTARSHLPAWAQDYLPTNVVDLQTETASWLREYAEQLSNMGKTIGISLVYILMGLVIGGMVAFTKTTRNAKTSSGLLTKHLTNRVEFLNKAFSNIVFSQVKISSINTFLTAIFLAGILPACGTTLPFTKTMILVTFLVGLLPVIGNLISNTVIVLISLSVSPSVAFWSLAFLVIVHKLEYFLNAHIIGSNIRAKAWEILLAMIFMEAAFGIAGLIAAPIYYAYLKDELSGRKLI